MISQPQEDVPVEDSSITFPTGSAGTDQTMQGETLENGYTLERMVLGRPAVLALIDNAEQEKNSGNTELAAATIERAIRMEPKNALLWSRLAEIQLIQKNWQQAYVLAYKSNSLAQGDRKLQGQNWQIIEQAKLAQGDSVSAEQARSRIKALSQPRP